MIVRVTPLGGQVTLEDPGDFRSFSAAVEGSRDLVRLGQVLADAGVGRVEGEHAFVLVDAVRRLAAGRVDESWEGGLEAMVAFARSKGWFDPRTQAIRAHVEWDQGPRVDEAPVP